MALGYENTGIAPRLISHAGDAISADIRRIGQGVRQDVEDYQAGRQAGELLTAAQSIDPTAPTFQKDVIGLLSKYPLALKNQGAVAGLGLLGQQWKAKQQENLLTSKFQNQIGLIGARNKLATGGLYSDTPAFAAPDTGGMTEDGGLATERPAMGGLRQHPLGVNPELPMASSDPAAEPDLMGGLDRQLRGIPGLPARVGAAEMARTAGQMARSKLKPEKGPLVRNIPGVGLAQRDPETDTWEVKVASKAPSRWLNMGSHWENVDTGEQKPIEMSPSQSANVEVREAATMDKAVAREDARVTKLVTTQIANRKRDLTSLEKAINDRQKAKEVTPEQQAELAAWQQQHGALRTEIAGLEAELGGAKEAKTLDKDTAAALLKEAGGDKEKARELARSRGYKL